MPIKRNKIKDKQKFKVTFSIPREIAKDYKQAAIVGDFNNWDPKSSPMKKLKKDGTFSASIELDGNNDYEFRYLLDGNTWLNEEQADKHVPTYFLDSENSVISL